MEQTKKDLEASNEAFTTLKGRVKVVATELKDRRIECRTLNVSVQDLTLAKSNLETENKELSARLSKVDKLNQERGSEIEILQRTVSELRCDLKSKEKELVDKGTVGDQALNTYKKKAQSLLANANARAAAANQARDDAEADAATARSEAQKAIKAARDAEKEHDETVRASIKKVDHLQKVVDELRFDRDKLVNDLESAQKECLKAFDELKESQSYKENLLEELNGKDDELEKEIEKNSGLEQDIAMARIKTKGLEDEVYELKKDLEKAKSAAFMARQQGSEQEKNISSSNSTTLNNQSSNQNHDTNADATIVMLQQELEVANEVIKELKYTLNAALSKEPLSPRHDSLSSPPSSPSSYGYVNGSTHVNNTKNQNNNDAVPLFFAFEKQAELNTARDEITRLAALLGDAESEKMESYERMEEMRKKMEEAESRLRRYEKLGGVSKGGGMNSSMNGSSLYNTSNGRRVGGALVGGGIGKSNYNYVMGGTGGVSGNMERNNANDSSVNLEYLKNIMLRYMNAMSLNEKKALIPVIGAVLELTPDEQAQAMENLGKNAGIQGVGTTLIENVQNKGFVSGLFGDLI